MPPNPPSKRVASPRAAWRFASCKFPHFSRKILNPPRNPRYAATGFELRIRDQIGTSVSFDIEKGIPPLLKCWHFEDDCVPNGSTGKVAAWGVLIYS